MKAVDIPLRLPIPWGQSAGGTEIRVVPQTSQIGIQDGAASWPTGFPPLNFQPIASGGVRPFGQDVNGGLNAISAWSRWGAAGGGVPWDSTFSTAIGGYPQGAVIRAALDKPVPGSYWFCLVDDNLSNPDTGGAGWQLISLLGTFTSGDAKLTYKTVADAGWFIVNDGSIGDASSGATTLADPSTVSCFTLFWTNISNNFCQVQDNSGTPVARGISASADYAANRRILVPKLLGRALIGAGAGSGLTNRNLGDGTIGAETIVLDPGNLPAHTHTSPNLTDPQHLHAYTRPDAPTAVGAAGGQSDVTTTSSANTAAASTGITLGATTGSVGNSTPVPIMQPSSALSIMIKL